MTTLTAKVRALRRRGPADSAKHVAELVRNGLYLRETHVWYELPLTGERPRRELPPEVTLKKASPDELPLVEQLGQSGDYAADRVEADNDCWLVVEDEKPLFCCWIFRSRTPVAGTTGGRLELPPGVVCLEDSVAAPAARGRGIAPGAWTAIADSLAAEGYRSMITKVGVENAPSRKAVGKSGFVEIAEMSFKRTGLSSRLSVGWASATPTAVALAERLFF